MTAMPHKAIGVGAVTLFGIVTLLVSNWQSDRLAVLGLSRRVAGALGGLAFLVAILTLEAVAAVILTFSIAAGIALLR